MRTFNQNGTINNSNKFHVNGSLGFCVQELENNQSEPYIYPDDDIKYELDSELVWLYDKLRDLFFIDTNMYYREQYGMPIFANDAGQNSDCGLTANCFSKLIQEEKYKKMPNFFRYLYLFDCQYLVGTIQNLIIGMDYAFCSFFKRISEINGIVPPSFQDKTYFVMSPSVISISSLLESYFTKAYSILDMFCKLAHEIECPMEDFSSYKKMKSANILWGARKNLKINGKKNTVFEKCELINTIEALRNEVVHNGSWELNPKVFITENEGHVMERFMLFPDLTQGHLATVKNRKHFFGESKKVNDFLPQIHLEYMRLILNTARTLNDLNLMESK